MPTTIYDSSHLTIRKDAKAKANSFITRISPPNNTTGYAPLLGIYDNSIMNDVKMGQMLDYKKCDGGTILINPGCPCPLSNSPNFVPPGSVSNIRYIIGSIILQWNTPTTGTGPFSYIVTPYLRGTALTPVTTSDTQYRFTTLTDGEPYTFTVCAVTNNVMGPVIQTTDPIIMPPSTLSQIMTSGSASGDITDAFKYIINSGLDNILNYIASKNLGPTVGSRLTYIWTMSIVSAWNWVHPDNKVNGIKDGWNWDNVLSTPLSDSDAIIWLCSVIDYVTPLLMTGSTYTSIYNCPSSDIQRVKAAGQWSNWSAAWTIWYNSRTNDGSALAISTQPSGSANWNNTIVIDGKTVTDISGFPAPLSWTRLTVLGNKQNYLTYNWLDVASTCLSAADASGIIDSVAPKTGVDRDAEIDVVKNLTASLTDQQKMQAEFWAGGKNTVAPPGMFVWLWKEYVRKINVSLQNIPYSLLDLAIHLFEGSRITWGIKRKYMEARPIQEIRRRYKNQQITSWTGSVSGDQWVPYQESNFVTPPFADFPSGHSHFSRAFALTMNKWFGTSIQSGVQITYDRQKLLSPMFKTDEQTTFGNFTITAGNSQIQSGIPTSSVVFSFTNWNDMAESAGTSRFYGGIHAETAHTASKTTAELVDQKINATWWV